MNRFGHQLMDFITPRLIRDASRAPPYLLYGAAPNPPYTFLFVSRVSLLYVTPGDFMACIYIERLFYYCIETSLAVRDIILGLFSPIAPAPRATPTNQRTPEVFILLIMT